MWFLWIFIWPMVMFFSVFEEVEILSPIIFTTAYDEYALKAFEVNSIDYLLKPIIRQDLERAMNKLTSLTSQQKYCTESCSAPCDRCGRIEDTL